MSRTSPLSALLVLTLLGAVLATAGVVTAAVAGPTAVGTDAAETATVANTTNYLQPAPDYSRQEYIQSNVDVAGAVAISAERLHGRQDVLTFNHRFKEHSNADVRLNIARETVSDAATRLNRLDARHASLLRGYSNGSLSRGEFLRQLARVQVSATRTRALLGTVRDSVEGDLDITLPVTLDTRIAALRAELVTLPAPLTSQVTASLNGSTDAFTLYAGGTWEGLVLARVDQTAFVRQATLRSQYQPSKPNKFEDSAEEPISVAFDRARALYPWVFDNLQSINRIGGFGDSDVYFFDLSHPHGDLKSYIHGGTTNVFRETHHQRPNDPPVVTTLRNDTALLDIAVNASTDTAPMKISVVRGAANVPADATIRVNGQRVGTTGEDGELWTIRPEGAFRVNATTADGESVTLAGP